MTARVGLVSITLPKDPLSTSMRVRCLWPWEPLTVGCALSDTVVLSPNFGLIGRHVALQLRFEAGNRPVVRCTPRAPVIHVTAAGKRHGRRGVFTLADGDRIELGGVQRFTDDDRQSPVVIELSLPPDAGDSSTATQPATIRPPEGPAGPAEVTYGPHVWLHVVSMNPALRRSHPIVRAVSTVGRGGADVAIPHPSVSRSPATLTRGADGAWEIRTGGQDQVVLVDGLNVGPQPMRFRLPVAIRFGTVETLLAAEVDPANRSEDDLHLSALRILCRFNAVTPHEYHEIRSAYIDRGDSIPAALGKRGALDPSTWSQLERCHLMTRAIAAGIPDRMVLARYPWWRRLTRWMRAAE